MMEEVTATNLPLVIKLKRKKSNQNNKLKDLHTANSNCDDDTIIDVSDEVRKTKKQIPWHIDDKPTKF